MGYPEQVIADGAVAYWRLNETSGTTAVATVGGVNATISAGVTLGVAGPVVGGKAFQYNGTSTAKVIAATGAYQTFGSGPVTLECWVKLLGAAAAYSFVDAHNSVSASAGVAIFCDGVNFTARARDGTTAITAPVTQTVAAVADQAWRHVVAVFTRSPDVLTLYINGAQAGQSSGTIGSTSSTTGTGLGCSSGGTVWYLNGALAECAIYQTALTPTQITAHYAAANPSAVSPFVFLEDADMPIYNIWTPITPSDTVDLPTMTDGIWVGTAGNVAAVMQNNQMPVVLAVPSGAWIPLAARRINATNTTATGIVALYER